MSKPCIERNFYRNGQIRIMNRLVDGKFQGVSRNWHYNGQLAEETRYRNGKLHGTTHQWSAKGQLLGSFTMSHGTGTMRHWYEDGRLCLEADLLDGKFHGRIRTWLRDGTLIQEMFCIGNSEVARAAYLEAAQSQRDWPQYKGQAAGHVARESALLDRKHFELYVDSLLEKSPAEAGKWLAEAMRPDMRSLATFRTPGVALRFVKALYDAGAVAATAVPIYAGKSGKEFADLLLVKLPQMKAKRQALRKLCQNCCDKRGGSMLPERDIGERHLLLSLA